MTLLERSSLKPDPALYAEAARWRCVNLGITDPSDIAAVVERWRLCDWDVTGMKEPSMETVKAVVVLLEGACA